jgi:tRNA (mo5U34)-methyltransferase
MGTTQPTTERPAGGESRDVSEMVASNPRWYHTMELGDGVVTPGWFDLRPIVDGLPWPEVAGKRCLDVGPYDGFIAFELERRGAREVMAADIGDFSGWDWPLRLRERGPRYLAEVAEPDPGTGFALAKRLLGSDVERIELSVYDLDPARVGSFDVVTCGSLLLHLRDPVGALEAIRSVCDGHLMSAEQIDPALTVLRRREAAGRFMAGERCQWWVPNTAGHRSLVASAGFHIVKRTRPYAIPLGAGHPDAGRGNGRIAQRLLTRGRGVPHAALLAVPEPLEGAPGR